MSIYQAYLIWTNDPNSLYSQLSKGLVRYDFIFQAHIKLITKHITRLNLFFYQALLFTIMFINILLELSSFNIQT